MGLQEGKCSRGFAAPPRQEIPPISPALGLKIILKSLYVSLSANFLKKKKKMQQKPEIAFSLQIFSFKVRRRQ